MTNWRDRVLVAKTTRTPATAPVTSRLFLSLPCKVETLEPLLAEYWLGTPGPAQADGFGLSSPTKTAMNLYVAGTYPAIVTQADMDSIPEETYWIRVLRPVPKYNIIYEISGVRDYQSYMLYLLTKSLANEFPV